MEQAVAATTERRRGRGGRPRKPPAPYVDMASSLEWAIAAMTEHRRDELAREAWAWPSSRYRNDPVGFAREVLGVEPWSKQVEILEAVRDYARVAVRSGHKCGKSHTAAIIALWFYCTFPDARVCMTSVTARQVDAILYREVRKIFAKARRPIDGEPRELARSGIKAEDFREIVGFTAKEVEGVAGISGANVLYIADEASGIPDEIFEAIEGNRAGGGRLLMLSNPTKCDGEFFDAFETKALRQNSDGSTVGFYKCLHVSSEDTPNAVSGEDLIPGLARRAYVEEKRAEWGEDSPLFKVRVRGEFVRNEERKICSLHVLALAKARWEETPSVGRLHYGIDVAGSSGSGDESVFVPRRGKKILRLVARRGLTPEGHVAELLGLIAEDRSEREPKPVVKVDRDGEVGARVYAQLAAHLERDPDAFELVGVRGGAWATREKQLYERTRDEVWGSMERWLREDGAIPEDARLEQDLHAPSWIDRVDGRRKATPKDDLRDILKGRSPDRGDAACLAVWELPAWADQTEAAASPAAKSVDVYDSPREIDAYRLDGVGGDDEYGSNESDGVYS